MARKTKVLKEEVVDSIEKIINRREVGYYYTPSFVSKYIANRMIKINKGTKVLDPCCGKEELISFFLDKNFHVDGMDIIKFKEDYNCNFIKEDFIKYYCSKKDNNNLELDYDYYIANPPYNCHEVDFIKQNKNALKSYFKDVGVHNMYSMFISAIIDFAKDNSVIGLITHDSFFTAKYHEGLRKKILSQCAIHEITMCPIDLFLSQGADVRTSIIMLQKGVKNQHEIVINNRPINTLQFKSIMDRNLNSNFIKKVSLSDITLHSDKDNSEFIIDCPEDIRSLFDNNRLGESFKCITGISTGNDKLYLSEKRQDPFLVPFYKNPGKDRFFTKKFIYLHKDFLEFDKQIKNFMVRNKKFLYKPGITCSSMGVEFTASILPENSVFGVNTTIICTEDDRWWLLAYLNSTLVKYIVRGVLIRSNMITSGYVSRVPLIKFSDSEKQYLTNLSKEAYNLVKENKSILEVMNNIDLVVNKSVNLSKSTQKLIRLFKEDLIKNT